MKFDVQQNQNPFRKPVLFSVKFTISKQKANKTETTSSTEQKNIQLAISQP